MTQLGRIEYATTGGRVNTDFVDNVGGVDCSDNEVNIKIFLNGLVSNGDLTVKQRNQILESMEDEVGEIVLDDAYRQSESISVTEQQGVGIVKEQIRFIHTMEKAGYLDRALEYIPDDETLIEREKQGLGLTRPVGRTITETLQRYSIAMNLLVAYPELGKSDLEQKSQDIAQRLGRLHGTSVRPFMRTAIDTEK